MDSPEILLVEDNPGDIRLTKEIFEEAGVRAEFHVARDGAEALDFLYRRNDYADAPRPDIVFLDWNLPKKTGEEVLTAMKNDENLKHIQVVVLSGSEMHLENIQSNDLQAENYITKPIEPGELDEIVDDLQI